MSTYDPTGASWVRLDRLLALGDPLTQDVWGCGPVGRGTVLTELDRPSTCEHDDPVPCRACEARRIAWFVRHGVDPRDPHPIAVDIGVPSPSSSPPWPVLDGNHRVAALTVLGAQLVPVVLYGDIDAAIAWLTSEDSFI
ncbi:hypothetical protein [Pseudactinotalea terrae]|uniref:hypothetical protein n=1 Tax=Pseudactinotalea terrae TaxID=1743262 RepID=UPI0012E20DB0|nr:hypothetical protein [Pseudactinotalea terrae]